MTPSTLRSYLAATQIKQVQSINEVTATLTESYPWGDYPVNHEPFHEAGGVALPAVGSTSTVLSFVVPPLYDGYISRYNLNFMGAGFTQGNGNIVWSILADNRPIKNFQNITTERGAFNMPIEIDHIRVYSGQTISVTVNHVANMALNGLVVVGLCGIFYPSERSR